MRTIEVEGWGKLEAEPGALLVLALEDGGMDILHRCGGKGRCTSCMVEVLSGDAGPLSERERYRLALEEGQHSVSRLAVMTPENQDGKPKDRILNSVFAGCQGL